MKALSIRSDFAAEIMNGTKIEEYRSWSTKYRGDPFVKDGSYWIKPIKVKGQLRLFNVDDHLIERAPFTDIHSKMAMEWVNKVIAPLRY